MKDLLRLRTSLNEEVEALINEQIKLEAESSAYYLAMASWCDAHGFDNSAAHFFAQSNEERDHMLKLYHYVLDMGGRAVSPAVAEVRQEYNSFQEVFEYALEKEIEVTRAINRLVARCHKAEDFSTVSFLDWFLKEQIEEEYIARRALELFEVIGTEGVGQYMIDRRIPELKYSEDGEA